MVESHDKLFKGVLAGSALVGEVESIRYLRPDVAVVRTLGSVLMPWRTKLPKRRLSRQTIVAVRDVDGWRFTAVHDGRVQPQQIPNRTRSRREPLGCSGECSVDETDALSPPMISCAPSQSSPYL